MEIRHVSLSRTIVALLAALAIFAPLAAYAQADAPYDVVKGERNENFVLPYGVANHDRKDPVIYTFDEPIGENWIMGIENSLSYTAKKDAKLVIIFREAAPSEKFVQLTMYGGEAMRYAVAANTPQIGYFNIYDKEEAGWSNEEPVGITHVENSGFVISDGRRIVVDRFDMEGFNLASVEFYGNDEPGLPANTYEGTVAVSVVFGSLVGTPVYYLPGAIMAGIGAVIGILLLVKKRKA